MKRVLVTGGGGFVGFSIVRQLLALGIEVIVLGRNRYQKVIDSGAACIECNITDREAVFGAIQGVDTVFHVAALAGIWGKWDDYYKINVIGTENVIAACLAANVKNLVYTSTPSVVFNGKDIENGDESLHYGKKGLCHYAKTKIIAEQKVIAANGEQLKTCAIRPHLIWGPGDPHLIPRLLKRGRMGELKKVGNCRNLVDISYVENVATAHVLAANNLETSATAAGEAYFISQGEPVNLWDWVDELFGLFKVEPIRKKVPYVVAYLGGAFLEALYGLLSIQNEPKMTRFLAEQLAKSHYFSIEKARDELGYEPTISTKEGLERLLAGGVE